MGFTCEAGIYIASPSCVPVSPKLRGETVDVVAVMPFKTSLIVVIAAGGIVMGLLCPGARSAPICAGDLERPGFGSAEHVVIIGTDGLGEMRMR